MDRAVAWTVWWRAARWWSGPSTAPPPPLEKLLRPASSALPQSAQANLLSPGGAEARGAVTGPDVPTGHSQGALCPIPELTAP